MNPMDRAPDTWHLHLALSTYLTLLAAEFDRVGAWCGSTFSPLLPHPRRGEHIRTHAYILEIHRCMHMHTCMHIHTCMHASPSCITPEGTILHACVCACMHACAHVQEEEITPEGTILRNLSPPEVRLPTPPLHSAYIRAYTCTPPLAARDPSPHASARLMHMPIALMYTLLSAQGQLGTPHYH